MADDEPEGTPRQADGSDARRVRRGRQEREQADPASLLHESRLMSSTGRQPLGRRVNLREIGRSTAVLVVLLLVVLAVVTVSAAIAKTGAEAASAKQAADAYVPPALAPPGSDTPSVAFIGDQTLVSVGPGVSTAERWTTLVSDELAVQVRTIGSDGAGYTVAGANRRTFEQMTSDLPGAADVVVLFGGIADVGVSAADLSDAMSSAVDAVRSDAPDATVVVIGPVANDGESSADVQVLRNRLRAAAGVADAQFVDPISANWLTVSDVANTDSGELNVDQERRIANRVDALLPLILG